MGQSTEWVCYAMATRPNSANCHVDTLLVRVVITTRTTLFKMYSYSNYNSSYSSTRQSLKLAKSVNKKTYMLQHDISLWELKSLEKIRPAVCYDVQTVHEYTYKWNIHFGWRHDVTCTVALRSRLTPNIVLANTSRLAASYEWIWTNTMNKNIRLMLQKICRYINIEIFHFSHLSSSVAP